MAKLNFATPPRAYTNSLKAFTGLLQFVEDNSRLSTGFKLVAKTQIDAFTAYVNTPTPGRNSKIDYPGVPAPYRGTISWLRVALNDAAAHLLRSPGAKQTYLDALTVFGSTGSGGGGTPTPGPNPFFYGMPMRYTGDSIITLDDNTSMQHWASAYTNGFFSWRADSRQSISGSTINDAFDNHDVLRADRFALFTAGVGPGVACCTAIGTNSMSLPAQRIKDGLDIYWAEIRRLGGCIIGKTILPSASNQSTSITSGQTTSPKQRYDDINAYIRSKAASDFLVWDDAAAWADQYVGNTDTGNLHCNTTGAQRSGMSLGTALLAKMGSLDPAVLFGTVNPADNAIVSWDLNAGTAGVAAGTTPPTGTIPTGITVTNNNAGVALACSVVQETFGGKTFPVLDIVGTVTGLAAQGTFTVSHNWNIGSIEGSGSIYGHAAFLSLTAVNDFTLPPVNVSGIGCSGGTVSSWGNHNTASVGGVVSMITQPVRNALRGRSIPAIGNTGTGAIVTTLRLEPGNGSFRLRYGQGYFYKAERIAYQPFDWTYTARTDLGGPLVGPTFTGTAANGQVLTARAGAGFKGGAATFSFQWQSSTDSGVTWTDISGANAITYTVSGMSGRILRCAVTGSNVFNGTTTTKTDYTPVSGTIA